MFAGLNLNAAGANLNAAGPNLDAASPDPNAVGSDQDVDSAVLRVRSCAQLTDSR